MKRWQCLVVKNVRSLTFSSVYPHTPHHLQVFFLQEFFRFALKSSQTCWHGWSYTKGSSRTSIFELCQPNNKVKPHSLLPGEQVGRFLNILIQFYALFKRWFLRRRNGKGAYLKKKKQGILGLYPTLVKIPPPQFFNRGSNNDVKQLYCKLKLSR